MNFNFITLNVHGLRNQKKRKSTFTWLKKQNSHVIFLQETYSNDNDIALWEKEWGGTFYANHGSNHSRGIIIGIKNNVDVKCEKVYSDKDGRLLCVKMNIDNNPYYLWNVYAPNEDNDRRVFLMKMIDVIQDTSSDGHVFIGGDLNTVLNPLLDKIGGNTPNPMCANIINNFLMDNEIVDIWRVKHGNEKRYTWKQNNPPIYSTLDYWFIPSSMDAVVKSVDIITAPKSDHLAVHMCLSFNKAARGSGYWKFNNEWLDDDDFTEKLYNMIDECVEKYSGSLSCADFRSLCKKKSYYLY